MFGTIPEGVSPSKIYLREKKDEQIDIYFIEKTLNFLQIDSQKDPLSVKMIIGVIDEKYANQTYFAQERAGSIGLCPTLQLEDETLLQR